MSSSLLQHQRTSHYHGTVTLCSVHIHMIVPRVWCVADMAHAVLCRGG